jgi:hypothetical protein
VVAGGVIAVCPAAHGTKSEGNADREQEAR